MWEKDLAVESPLPWYLPLDKSYFSLSTFRLTAVGRFITKNMVIFVSFKYLFAIVDFLFSCSFQESHGFVSMIFSVHTCSILRQQFIRVDLLIFAGHGPGICGTCPKRKSTCSKLSGTGCRRACWRWKVSDPSNTYPPPWAHMRIKYVFFFLHYYKGKL